MIKSKRMRLFGHVVGMGGGEVYIGLWWGNIRKKVHTRDTDLDGI